MGILGWLMSIGLPILALYILRKMEVLYTFILTVNEGENVVIERLGKFYKVYGPGIYPLLPFIYKPKFVHWEREIETVLDEDSSPSRRIIERDVFHSYRIKMNMTRYDIPSIICTTKSLIPVHINIVVYYMITQAKDVVYAFDDLYQSIRDDIEGHLISIVSQYEAIELTPTLIQEHRLSKEGGWNGKGISLSSISVQNIAFSDEYTQMMIDAVNVQTKYDNERLTLEKQMETKLYELECRRKIEEAEHALKLLSIAQQNTRHLIRINDEVKIGNLLENADSDIRLIRASADARISITRYELMKKSGLTESYFVNELLAESWRHINEKCNTMIIPSEYTSCIGKLTAARNLNTDSNSPLTLGNPLLSDITSNPIVVLENETTSQ